MNEPRFSVATDTPKEILRLANSAPHLSPDMYQAWQARPARQWHVATNRRSGFIRDAPRGRRSICATLQNSRRGLWKTAQTESARPESVLTLTGACLDSCRASDIERRPRGASRMNPLLRSVATCRSSQAMVGRLGAWLKADGAPAAPTEKSRHANKAGNCGLIGHGTFQQM